MTNPNPNPVKVGSASRFYRVTVCLAPYTCVFVCVFDRRFNYPNSGEGTPGKIYYTFYKNEKPALTNTL